MRARWICGSLVAVALGHGVVHSGAQQEVLLKDLKSHVGEDVVACGRAVTYSCDDDTGELVLSLEQASGGPEVAIPRQYWPDSRGRSITDLYLIATVCARGLVSKNRTGGGYRVTVHARDQIEARAPFVAVPQPPFAPEALHTCAEGVRPPKLRREVKPRYTRDAMRALERGKMYLEIEVLADGTVRGVRELTTLAYGLGQQAVAAVKQWRFQPATLAGRAVPVVVTVEMTFTLR